MGRHEDIMILLVEDEPSILNLVSMNLVARGYQVAMATTGNEALACLDDNKPDLMILDLRLPEVSGWEVLDHVNCVPFSEADFPVVVMTASVMDANLLLDRYPCVMEVLIKPFDINTLMAVVQNVVSDN